MLTDSFLESESQTVGNKFASFSECWELSKPLTENIVCDLVEEYCNDCVIVQYGSTAAHLAAVHGHDLVLRSLVQCNVSVTLPDAVSSYCNCSSFCCQYHKNTPSFDHNYLS